MIALAVQTDNGPAVEVVLILCTNTDSSKRYDIYDHNKKVVLLNHYVFVG